jgi:hypothetical protein
VAFVTGGARRRAIANGRGGQNSTGIAAGTGESGSYAKNSELNTKSPPNPYPNGRLLAQRHSSIVMEGCVERPHLAGAANAPAPLPWLSPIGRNICLERSTMPAARLRLDLPNHLVEVHEAEAKRGQVILPDRHTRSRLTQDGHSIGIRYGLISSGLGGYSIDHADGPQKTPSGFPKQIELIRFANQTRWHLNWSVANRTAIDASFDFAFKGDDLWDQNERQSPRAQPSLRLSSLSLRSHRYSGGKIDGDNSDTGYKCLYPPGRTWFALGSRRPIAS